MKGFAFSFCLVLILMPRALAQHGTAPNDYYPPGYSGDTWSGEVTSTNDETREITLTYTKGSKTESFTGVLQQGYKVKLKDGTSHELKASEVSKGTRLMIFYVPKIRKDGDKKVKYYEIFRLQVLK
jgi:hypothetical protein